MTIWCHFFNQRETYFQTACRQVVSLISFIFAKTGATYLFSAYEATATFNLKLSLSTCKCVIWHFRK